MDNKKIDIFYDLIDKAVMLMYNDLRIDYLECFISIAKSFTTIQESDIDINDLSLYDKRLSDKTKKALNEIYDKFSSYSFTSEEVRLATELILIKGFKHRNLMLDFVTPDTINYLFSYIINSIVRYNKKVSHLDSLRILDTVLGTGNLLQAIINNAQMEIEGFGIEHDELLTHLAIALNDLLDNKLIINYQDALKPIDGLFDIIIGDFGESKDIYNIILERLDNLDDGYFIYLINNDFFNNATEEFKTELISCSTLIGLIVLPKNFVNKEHIGKSILIGKKEVLTDYHLGIIQMDEELNEKTINSAFNKIDKLINKINKTEEEKNA